ncbi:3-hydroxyacyl-CoA dehydrogenase NAD-binding domain-containing protein [Arenicella sp.]|nr:3-hydroxyacyl-CoA dehydrogenase NAD-binding domain-containing protein [Arenicella sp.]
MMPKTIDDIENILVVGAGTLGLRIALRCALDGYKVKMYDINPKQLAAAQAMQTHLINSYLRKGMLTKEMVEQAATGLTVTADIDEAVTEVDLVSESIIENIDVKQAFYADFAPRLSLGTILTTNTSYLLPSQLLAQIVEPEKFCALHFHDVFNQVVVDVMPHPATEQTVIELLMAFAKRIHQIPVFIKKEHSGYLFNSMLMALIGSAGTLRVNDVGSIQDIDRSFMANFGVQAGPFGMLDQVGLDTALHITSARKDNRSIEFSRLLKIYVDQGKLGIKSGEGFYTYPHPEFQHADFLGK